MSKIIAVMPVLLVLSVVFVSGCTTGSEITNFEECVDAGVDYWEIGECEQDK